MSRRAVPVLLAFAGVLGIYFWRSVSPPRPAAPSHITVLAGATQRGEIGSFLPQPILVQVQDARGLPLAGVPLSFRVAEGGGALEEYAVVTGPEGTAADLWRLGSAPGAQWIEVSVLGTAPAGPVRVMVSAEAIGGSEPAAPAPQPPEPPFAPSAYGRVVLADRPSAFWPFDDAAGDVAHDRSGQQHDARFIGAATRGVTLRWRMGTAVSMSHARDGVRAEYAPWMAIDALSVEAWVQPARVDYAEGALLIDKGNSWGLHIQADGRPAFAFPFQPGRVVGPEPLLSGDIYHLVGTYERGTMRLYVNGVLAGEDASASPQVPSQTEPMHIGRGLSDSRFEYEGLLDEVAIYDHVLTAERIREHYDAGK